MGGPDGLSPQHLEDLAELSVTEGGEILVKVITSLVPLDLKGKTPKQIFPYFFEATLVHVSHRKKNGGVWPIITGRTMWRLSTKCASALA